MAGRRSVPALVERHRLAARLGTAVSRLDPAPATPCAVVDLDAFDANADDLVARAGGTPIRVASKSLRVPALVQRALARDGFAGVLGYTLREALWLVDEGISDDVVVAYPTVDLPALRRLTSSPSAAGAVTIMVDDLAHLDVVDSMRSSKAVPVRVAIDVDAGLQAPGGVHVGPKRSPLRSAEATLALARAVVERPGFVLVGVMTYEGQVAGVPDRVPGQAPRMAVVRRIKQASLAQLRERREAVATGISELADLSFFNAGGSGSIAESAADPAVTEVTAGSGLLVPGLFDHYRSFAPRPAAYFGVPVTRRPGPGVATVHGGGYTASGPAGPDRQVLPWAPPGLELTALEAAGEVQTPLVGPGADLLRIGELVWFRHAKSGELFEHTDVAHLLAGDRITETVPTYRGAGQAFG
ncbi:D-serine deaminase-like pyridoxal phosphate-dependent protein [Nocardioides zeae]|uniref:D-serine deaminase-like pyridoxal phosphate-dependent protein n=1 Tax=Nocardioides zeae TaxID=1457234 RepID=A0ACC6IN59_9ACTN|nr:amino acid deaminase/aldolase [Nocardioides zeae]MDR6176047.1 D-serine deaminase-like pyridoxal phosphate-dependent protein [Nocardioides zeae]MDR6212097.1 D-serine deaminase-like pyridoxal phosphate-dependent protein [Nocardioides zeae]